MMREIRKKIQTKYCLRKWNCFGRWKQGNDGVMDNGGIIEDSGTDKQ